MPSGSVTAPPGGLGGSGGSSGPLSPGDLAQIESARTRAKKVRRCAAVAMFGGWSTAVVAFPTLIVGIFSTPGLLVGIAMSLVAVNEFRGGARVRRFDESACRLLALNQVFFSLTMCAYCVWRLWEVSTSPDPFLGQRTGDAQSDQLLASIGALNQTLSYAMYAGGIGLSVVVQGSTALYYWTRRSHIRAYINSTPAWVVQLQRVARAA